LVPTAAENLHGLKLDNAAHDKLIRSLTEQAHELAYELTKESDGDIENHGSSAQVSTWIIEKVLNTRIRPPVEPKLVDLVQFLRQQGGIKPDRGGNLKALDIKGLVKPKAQLNLTQATIVAWEAGYIGHDRSTMHDSAPEIDELLGELEKCRFGHRVFTIEDAGTWDDYQAERDDFDRQFRADPYRISAFMLELGRRIDPNDPTSPTRTSIRSWRTTKTGHLAITKGSKLRRAEQMANAYPQVSAYLIKHAQWSQATKLIDAFGPTLRHWRDDDDYYRGQFRTFSAWTGRQSCVDPNLQQQPRTEAFRSLWIAPPGRKLVIADYSQIELRLAAIESGDERLLEVYRQGADVHDQNAAIIFDKPIEAVTKGDRQAAKAVGFLTIYGGGPAKLAETVGCDLDKAHTFLARFFQSYPKLRDYRERMPAQATQTGWIEIRPGRRVKYDPQKSSPTQAINAPVQGGAASVQMLAIRLIHDALRAEPGLDTYLAASVHDEFILDAPDDKRAREAANLLVKAMTDALVKLYRESEQMGVARLTAAAVVSSWAEKP
jgi:hypothetical protein